jgi:altronate hydrolase
MTSVNIDLISTAPASAVQFDDVAIRLHPDDNIAIAKVTLQAETLVTHVPDTSEVPGTLRTNQLIPSGHKFAIKPISEGDIVRRYGQFIGYAKQDIGVGEHVHVHNLGMGVEHRDEQSLHDVGQDYAFSADYKPVTYTPEPQRRTFIGYKRADGRVGTRNYIAVISSVNCSAHTVRQIAKHFTPEVLAPYPNVDGVIAIAHGYGCATRVGSDDYILLQRVLAGMAMHPNVGAYLLVGLGCETNQVSEVVENYALAQKAAPGVKRLHGAHTPAVANLPITMTLQENGGIRKTVAAGIAMIEQMLPELNAMPRTPQPVSELLVALQCGGSDGWSGVTANPVLGLACDELVRQGGSVNLAETPEIYGAEHMLTRRAINKDVGEKLIAKVRWWEKHAAMHGVEINNNPSTGNKVGGLTTIYEKSLGAAAKAGNTPLMDVVSYAEQIATRGFTFMDTPGYDPVAATGQVAGGCNLLVFTTGRGSCFGFKPTPSIKVASNTPMFERMIEDMDINAGKVVDGTPMQDAADELFEMMIAVASGQKTKSEAQDVGEDEFQPWSLGGIL